MTVPEQIADIYEKLRRLQRNPRRENETQGPIQVGRHDFLSRAHADTDADASKADGMVPQWDQGSRLWTPVPANAHAHDTLLPAEWTSYNPTWSSTGTQPAIGNGIKRGAYLHTGKLLVFWAQIIAGSTTTFGTGDWKISLPASFAVPSDVRQAVSLAILDTGTRWHPGSGTIEPSAVVVYPMMVNAGHLGPTVPFAWANGDEFTVSGAVQIA